MTLDLSQFHESFFEESFEALDAMEASLLKLNVGVADHEAINTIFRGAHSMKGGAGMLGFTDVTSFTHTLETLLDALRSGRMQVTTPILDNLLKSVDVLREMLGAVKAKQPVAAQKVADLQFDLEMAVASQAKDGAPAGADAAPAPAAAVANTAAQGWNISFKPLPHMLVQGNDPLAMFAALREIGPLQALPDLTALPPAANLDPQTCYISWRLHLASDCPREQVEAAFDWALGDCELAYERGPPPTAGAVEPASQANTTVLAGASASSGAAAVVPTAVPAPAASAAVSASAAGTGVARGGSAGDGMVAAAASDSAKATAAGDGIKATTGAPDTPKAAARNGDSAKGGAAASEASSIRVSTDKVDELINTVGELVITQAMLSELGRSLEGAGAEQLRSGLVQLERNMRQLQESVMRVRMLPISVAFSRFPRMVHDLASRLNKKIELKLSGEQTELDKTVLEKIGDPLVHLVRNSLDHGIEAPDVRVAKGKPEFGTIHLNAFHRGGNIAVEVQDDGAGLDKDRILAKARSRGLVAEHDVLTDDQIHELIFLPGFSTAEKTTEVSGRGVGMDVVRQRVKELGGTVEISTERGRGSRFLITLPLTLAIVDGQSVIVGTESYIVPLTSIVESLQLKQQQVSRLAGRGEVFKFREEYLPIVRLYELFGLEPRSRALHEGLIVVAEGDGRRIGLFVDELLGQQQVVIKSMESNYGRVEGVAGATILGDGSVALILDLPGLIRCASMGAAA